MFYVTRAMTGGMRLYNYCYDAAIECAKCNIKRRLTANEKIKVTFLPISDRMAGGVYLQKIRG